MSLDPATNPESGSSSLAQPEKRTAPAPALDEAAEARSGEIEQFVSFKLGAEEYAVTIMAIREIKGWSETTRLPNTPEYLRGVLNLRGIIVPVFDLRCRFGMGITDTTSSHVIIIVSVNERTVGLLVDAVSDILSVDKDEIKAAPETGSAIDDAFLRGLVARGERMVALIDVDILFNNQVLTAVDSEMSGGR